MLLLTERQMSDYKGAALLLPAPPSAHELLAERGITPRVPSTRSRKIVLPCHKALYPQRHPIENAFGLQCSHYPFLAVIQSPDHNPDQKLFPHLTPM